MFEDLQVYRDSVIAANRRDVPYYINSTGTVIDGGASGYLAWSDDGNRKAWGRFDVTNDDYYLIQVTAVNQLTVTATDEFGDVVSTVFGGVTPGSTRDDLVPGVTIVLNASLTTGHIAKVYPGMYLLESGTIYNERGEAGDWKKAVVKNPGSVAHNRCEFQIGRAGWITPGTNDPIVGITLNSLIPVADEYDVTVAAGTSSGKKVTFTGSLATHYADNVAPGTTNVPFDTGDIGFTFDLNASVANGDTATVRISDYADALEVCGDSAGTPDTGTTVVWDDALGLIFPLNIAGGSDNKIPASGYATIWIRWNGDVTHAIGRGVAAFKTKSYQATT